MGKLTSGRILRKKDYILKTLPGQKSLSHKETMEYIRIHLPSIYPGTVETGQLGYSVQWPQMLVFILHTPLDKEERRTIIVPFLLLPEFNGGRQNRSGLFRIRYEDGCEDILLENGSVKSVDWIEASQVKAEAGSEPEISEYSLENPDKPVWKIFNTGRTKSARANPFAQPQLVSKVRAVRITVLTAALMTLLVLSYLGVEETRKAQTDILEARLETLSKKAWSLGLQREKSLTLLKKKRDLGEYELYTPYSLMSELYGVISSSGSFTSITSIRISKEDITIEGYTSSSLQLLDAFSKSPRFGNIELSAVTTESDDAVKPAPSREGFIITGTVSQTSRKPNGGEG